jgi:transposase
MSPWTGESDINQSRMEKALVVGKILAGHMTNAEGAATLGLGERQMIQLKKRYVNEGGAQALAHGNGGRKPKHAIPEGKDHVAELYTTKSLGSNNPTLRSFWRSTNR